MLIPELALVQRIIQKFKCVNNRIQIRKPFIYRSSLIFLICWALVSILAPILSNEKALFISDEEGWHFPIMNDGIKYEPKGVRFILKAPIPYSPSSLDMGNANTVSPFDEQNISSNYYRHWLGTDELGRDVLAHLIHGSKTAFVVGILSMLIAGLIGVLLGVLSALIGDDKLHIKAVPLSAFLIFFPLFFISIIELVPWNIKNHSGWEKTGIFFIILLIWLIIYLSFIFLLSRLNSPLKTKSIKLPFDLIIGRVIEIMDATPLLFLIVALASIFKPSMFSIIIVIGITGWVGIAKYARAETFKIKEQLYIETGKALGFSTMRLTIRHILPNALSPIITSLAFGVAAAILIEASLSFMGFGLSASDASWGQLLSAARNNYQAWWLVIFPGFAVFLTVFSCNTLGEHLSR